MNIAALLILNILKNVNTLVFNQTRYTTQLVINKINKIKLRKPDTLAYKWWKDSERKTLIKQGGQTY